MSLSGIWNGEQHYLEPGVDFSNEGARKVIADWEELEDEEELSPFESPNLAPVLRETGDLGKLARSELAQIEQAWGSLSIALSSLSRIIGCQKDQYQLINHQTDRVRWSFKTKEFFSERL